MFNLSHIQGKMSMMCVLFYLYILNIHLNLIAHRKMWGLRSRSPNSPASSANLGFFWLCDGVAARGRESLMF